MKVIYICEGCGEQYDNSVSAYACEARDPGERLVDVGDIVFAKAGFGWFNGDKRWIRNPSVILKSKGDSRKECPNGNGNCFASCCGYDFYYVVTAIDEKDHRVRYHLATRAMLGRGRGYVMGYTFNVGHHAPNKILSPSDFLIRSGRLLVGEKADHLL